MVDRCICSDILFSDVKSIGEERGYTEIKEFQDAEICAVHCELCRPYLEKMLETGQTRFSPGEAG